jgi:hypothetical protein
LRSFCNENLYEEEKMPLKDKPYSKVIEEIMLKNNGFAPLKLIYEKLPEYKDMSLVRAKTPNNTIQAIVQRDKRFKKIGLGVYALSGYEDKIHSKSSKQDKHSQMEGMLLEIGNQDERVKNTYTRDKNGVFENKPLDFLRTLGSIPPFTYQTIIKDTVSYIDVIWFNERSFPLCVFEVETTTDFRDALIKFMELQDFQTKFYCVSDKERREKFEKEKSKYSFIPIKERVAFLSYEQLENDYKNAVRGKFIKY